MVKNTQSKKKTKIILKDLPPLRLPAKLSMPAHISTDICTNVQADITENSNLKCPRACVVLCGCSKV